MEFSSNSPAIPQPNSPYQQTPNTSKFGDAPDGWSGDDSAQDPQDGSRKRPRPMSVSCELCKVRKVKCDRGQPSCGWCTRNGQQCVYKERKKPGLRAGYGRELEQRLDRLEETINNHGRLIENALRSTGHLTVPGPMSQDNGSFQNANMQQAHLSRPEASAFPQRQHSYPDPQQLAASGMLAYNDAMKGPMPSIQRTEGFAQHSQNAGEQASSQNVQQGQSQNDYYQQTNPQLGSPIMNTSNDPQTSIQAQYYDLPPYDLLYGLVDLYFQQINGWCPLLHRKTTLERLFGASTLDEADRILLHAIVATTLRFSTDSRLNEENRRNYHDLSKRKVLLYGLENSSVKALQALVILALDLVGSSNGPPGWNVLAMMTRSVVQLGLAVETTSSSAAPEYPSIYTLRAMVLPEAKSWIEDESRRRLFWMIYLLDRYATVATAFEFALDEKEIDRKLPCRDDLWSTNQPVETRWFQTSETNSQSINKPENLGSFSYYVEILGILSKIHLFLKKPVDISALSDVEQWQATYRNLDNTMRQWQRQLPNDYGNFSKIYNTGTGNKRVNCGWIMLHATYRTTLIRLHSSAAYPTTRSPIFAPSLTAADQCRNAVEDITALTRYVVNNGMLSQLGAPFAFTLWVAARVMLVHGCTIERQVSSDIDFLVSTLQELGHYWQVASRYSAILQRVLDEYRESERSAAAHGQRVTPSSVKILADMRRCAYDLDILISRQPRQPSFRMGPATASRTPAAHELEYLEAFDFFNMPRLPVPVSGPPMNGAIDPSLQLGEGSTLQHYPNIGNFTADANSDWLYKPGP